MIVTFQVLFAVGCLLRLFDAEDENQGYLRYHQQVIHIEELISEEAYRVALAEYEQMFLDYDFVFLRDYQVATQLAVYMGETEKAFFYIRKGMAAGWERKALNRNKFLNPLHAHHEWKKIEKESELLRRQYLAGINLPLKDHVYEMYKKDQQKALGALFRIGNKARERYALKKFAPHSEIQMRNLIRIVEYAGYPGEQLIGNDFWMSTIVSHHNSITRDYVKQDTLFSVIKPRLIEALDQGQISPYEFAMMEGWRIAVSSDRTQPGYGFLNPPGQSTLSKTDSLRMTSGLRTVKLRNKLVDVEKRTGMDFYLPDWVEGEISIDRSK